MFSEVDNYVNMDVMKFSKQFELQSAKVESMV